MSFNATFVKKKNQPWISPLRKTRGEFKNKVIWLTHRIKGREERENLLCAGLCMPFHWWLLCGGKERQA